MNENLAYWQLDFTVESQANLAQDCMVMPKRPANPQPTSLLGLRPSACGYGHPLFSDIFFKAWSHPCIVQGKKECIGQIFI